MATYNEMTKIYNNVVRDRILCPNCGHSVLFAKLDKIICKHCGKYVFKNKKAEFEYRLKESINKNK